MNLFEQLTRLFKSIQIRTEVDVEKYEWIEQEKKYFGEAGIVQFCFWIEIVYFAEMEIWNSICFQMGCKILGGIEKCKSNITR